MIPRRKYETSTSYPCKAYRVLPSFACWSDMLRRTHAALAASLAFTSRNREPSIGYHAAYVKSAGRPPCGSPLTVFGEPDAYAAVSDSSIARNPKEL